ncbi:LEA type 2 family protein [Acidiluteibacter ferrifornacis]|uniref:Water stress and hypersensitive response domain-containing protein n=1 Tax=Acidiluteibacter ferrifornacis TaxID=2692424 RepID=A0A6N9NH59_9FLAO|nr:LEA type 2 family protein [Acidiluteibacter ferrifornacis]NBG65169.1 hypothetical protein [Acidiluteibacter ferrifornacis]
MKNNSSNVALMIVFILATFFTSCSGFEEVELSSIQSVKMAGMTGNKVDFVVNAEIYNPNSFGVSVVGADLNIQVEGIDLGSTSLGDSFKIDKKSKEVHEIQFSLNISKLPLSAIPKLLSLASSGRSDVKVKVDGNIKGRAFLITKKFPVAEEERVPLKF